MITVNVRPMTAREFNAWQHATTAEFAAEQVTIGRWSLEGSVERAIADNTSRLPQGMNTPRMLFLQGTDADGATVGHAWVSLDHPQGSPTWRICTTSKWQKSAVAWASVAHFSPRSKLLYWMLGCPLSS